MASKKLIQTKVFCDNLRTLMKEHKVNQRKLAKEMKMTDSNFSRIINGNARPTFDQLLFIKKRFKCSLDWLMCDDCQ